MSKPINTYNDLLEEKERLEGLLATQKMKMRESADALEAEFKPAFSAISFLGTLVTRDSTNPVLGAAANSIIDVVLRKILLARAGWLAKLVLPVLAKNLSSHYISEHEDDIFRKLFKLFGFGKKKKKKAKDPVKTNGQAPANEFESRESTD